MVVRRAPSLRRARGRVPHRPRRGRQHASAAFQAALARTTHVRAALAGYALASRPRGADAGSARLARPAGDGWIAAGDAAISYDPLSSHGILNALHTGTEAGHAVAAALDGDASAIPGYAEHVDAVYATYLHHLHAYYAAETRWSDHPFWARRHREKEPAQPAG